MNILNICFNISFLKKISIFKLIFCVIIILIFLFVLIFYLKNKKIRTKKRIIILTCLLLIIPIINITFYFLNKLDVSFAKCFIYANKKSIANLQKTGTFICQNGNKKITCIGDQSCHLEKIPTEEKEGYTFMGWDSNKKCINPLTKLEIAKNTIFYYCFDKITYKLLFDERSGIISGNKEYLLSIDENYTLDNLPKAAKDGYNFLGWSSTENCDSLLEINKIVIHKDTTYYACYKEQEKVKETIKKQNISTEGVCPNGDEYNILTQNGITTINGTLIVNKTYSLPSTYNPGGLTDETKTAFNKMKSDASNEKLSIWNQSGYRSYTSQEYIYNNYLANTAQEYVDLYSARPGHSEHQSGMAIDINDPNDTFLTNYPKESAWVNQNAYKYGFILRYPKGKENITGYNYESWHYRYVGVDLAEKLYNNGSWITLEEYFCISSKYA